MAITGDVIENIVTGERMVFLQTGAETGGELLQIDVFVKPGGAVAGAHVHPGQQERFIVRSGSLRLRVNRDERVYQRGEEAIVPAGTPHVWWNAGDDELNVLTEFRPAGRFEGFITTFFGLVRAGHVNAKGMPPVLHLAVIAREYRDVIYPASPPRFVQTILFAVLGPIGRLCGYKPDFPYQPGTH